MHADDFEHCGRILPPGAGKAPQITDSRPTLGVQASNPNLTAWHSSAPCKPQVTPVLASSRFVGWVETLGGSVGTAARDTALTVAGRLGVAEAVFVQGAVPRV